MKAFIYKVIVKEDLFLCKIKYWNKDIEKIFEISKDKNDVSEIEKEFNNQWVIGYNIEDYDNLIINYIVDNIFVDTKEIHEFSKRLKGTKESFLNASAPYKLIKKYKHIDLMKMLFSKDNYVEAEDVFISMKLKDVREVPNTENKAVIMKALTNVVRNTELLAINKKEDIAFRGILKNNYSMNCFSKNPIKIGMDILINKYCWKSKESYGTVVKSGTTRNRIILRETILREISFKSKVFSDMLDNLKNKVLKKGDKIIDESLLYGGVLHVFGSGGLHSKDEAGKHIVNEGEVCIEIDVKSCYPSMMSVHNISPMHLKDEHFKSSFKDIVNIRNKYEDNDVYYSIIKKALNGICGNLSSNYSWIHDYKAAVFIKLNMQLLLAMLSEKFLDSGFKVNSINADSITVTFAKHKEIEFQTICRWWKELTGFKLSYEVFTKIFKKNVNCFFALQPDGNIVEKGIWNTEPVIGASYNKPIIKIAAREFFINEIPVEETILMHKNIFDFCAKHKYEKGLHVLHGDEIQQNTNRYYVSNKGKSLYKTDGKSYKYNIVKRYLVTMLNFGKEEQYIKNYDINYDYYIKEAKKITNITASEQLKLF